MLPKINRITKRKDFEIIFKKSKSIKTNLFVLKITKNDLGLNRFGFVVSSKVSKRAVVRNKIRRRLSELMKSEMGKIKKGTDLVLIVLPGADRKNFSEIREDVIKTLLRNRLIA